MANPTYTCRIAFASNPFASTPTWVDVSANLMSFSTRRGRQWELNRMEAGTAQVTLLNMAGDYWPNNTTGAYTPNVLPWKRINIRAGNNLLTNPSFEVGDPPTGWDVGGVGATFVRSAAQVKIGTYSALLTRNGTDCFIYKYDLTSTYFIGREVTLGCWVYATVASRARIRLLSNGGVDQAYSSYHSGVAGWEWLTVTIAFTSIGLDVELYVINGDTSAYFDGAMLIEGSSLSAPVHDYQLNAYDLYTGYIESWNPDFIQKPIKVPIMKLTCVEGNKNLSAILLNDGTGYSSELSGTRINNVLTTLGWNTTDRNIATGQTTLQSTGPLVNVNGMGHLYTVQDTEVGILFVSASGAQTFHDRYTRLDSPYASSSGIFGDISTGGLGYTQINLALEDVKIFNDVRCTRVGGTEQVATNTTSIDAYGKRSFAKTGLLITTDDETLSQSQYLLSRYSSPVLRVKQLTFKPDADQANLYPKILGSDISTRVTVKLAQASINNDYHIEGIADRWEATQPWLETTWWLSDADWKNYFVWGVYAWDEAPWIY